MNRFAFFALAAALALGGCTALDQFPERSNDYSADLSKLDCDYAKALAKINGEPDEVTCPAEPGKTENGATKSTETASKKTTSTATDLALTSLTETANTGANEDQQVRIRNNEIDKRLAVIDANFENFRIALSQENVKADFGVSLVEVGVGGAGALAAETASQDPFGRVRWSSGRSGRLQQSRLVREGSIGAARPDDRQPQGSFSQEIGGPES